MKIIIYSTASLFLLFSCGQTQDPIVKNGKKKSNNSNVASVFSPIEGVSQEAQVYSVSATKSDTILLGNGGSVIFDENCFVDANGKPLKGKVDVQWQEFHTLGDIMASGIPMKYDSAGVAFDLVSGGMFTIDATQKGKEVEMAKGKGATVNLASVQDTPCYNFYSIDEATGKWNYETTDVGQNVDDMADNDEAAEDEEEKEPNTILETTLNTHGFPLLKDKEIIGWKLDKTLSDGQKQIIQSSKTKIKIKERTGPDTYGLVAHKKDKKEDITLNFKAEPYTLEEAMADTKVNSVTLQKEVDALADYQKKMAAGKVIRTIKIAGFGTYNWDIINKRANSQALFAKFKYPEGINSKVVALSLLSPDENAVVTYDATEDRNFSFDPGKRNCLIGILPSNELVTVSNKGFNKARKARKGSEHTFKFKKTGIKISSPSDIMKYMDKLI